MSFLNKVSLLCCMREQSQSVNIESVRLIHSAKYSPLSR